MDFQHSQASHCESGVMSAMLRHHGLPLSEPMTFGLSSALSFAYLPIIKINGLPLVAYRMPPKAIIKGLQKPLGLKMRFETFGSQTAGVARLNELLDQGKLVGLQTSVFWLPYLPEDLRFHFNAHNVLAFGREASGDYLLSDPVAETTVTCPAADLQRARFAKGALAPKGLLYYPIGTPQTPDWQKVLPAAIKKTTRIMLDAPLPIIGVRGIRWLAKAIEKLDAGNGAAHSKLFIGQVVRMQEEIGTGGGGFRFIYASFLQEAADLLNRPALGELAEQLIDIGDEWREFALATARMIRDRDPLQPPKLAAKLRAIADREQAFFRDLRSAA
ncbi:BtrH N-terminal domain-containing protein [Dechloromonas sp. XY25]|uniref:BtrH N-terminal domain-containing protein n=1 Tax=Dechloromonas hankyongensis TaxID=2908002 RepID=A0ABS9K3F8_9RHOO|nr:BtrH N-terminal domain-containing protein [Dechloromonas hankyongensis]MCG2577709.1 BtrH N-terminal domain-containing protein [Dechloromonas hankyongensis]